MGNTLKTYFERHNNNLVNFFGNKQITLTHN